MLSHIYSWFNRSEALPSCCDPRLTAGQRRLAWQAELMAARSEPHRHYHDQRHLRECLALWARWRDHSPRAGEVAIALSFHDAIYDPQAESK